MYGTAKVVVEGLAGYGGEGTDNADSTTFGADADDTAAAAAAPPLHWEFIAAQALYACPSSTSFL